MRPIAETREKWNETLRHSSSFSELQRAVKFNGPSSPCIAGCRSVCWRTFLLFQNAAASSWSQTLTDLRGAYHTARLRHLKFIKNPEQLAALPVDPLADDPDSPWDAARRDELVRSEIRQDVQRLPDEAFYHEARTQDMIVDILFLYCKLNPRAGGYRQGMHELLAPIVHVVHADSIDREAAAAEGLEDQGMLEMLDAGYIEHDAFSLFAKVMENAQPFYETGEGDGTPAGEKNTIVEKSKHIHESILMRVDPELAEHLKSIDVLPQIFLIRWIRLLFGREFPFEQLLVLWDTIFAFDPSLQSVDMICVAMLIRVRWTLLEADYAAALQLLLKYPVPQSPHGPHTFVDDAVYLKHHTDAAGGSTLIMKYSGKQPAATTPPKPSSRPVTPNFQGLGSLRQRTLGARSPLGSTTTRILQHPGGVEALFQSATKNVMERGEKLGINQAVRDAMGEIRRNVQGLQDARMARGSRDSMGSDWHADHAVTPAFLESRNRQLAAMLNETVESLKMLASGKLEGDKEQHIQAIEVAAARAQFVKVYLEDASLMLPDEELPPISSLTISANESGSPTVALDTTPVVMTSSAVEAARSTLSSPASDQGVGPKPQSEEVEGDGEEASSVDVDRMDTDVPEIIQNSVTDPLQVAEVKDDASSSTSYVQQRPSAPIPTRSTLAQSSFAWMLEPDMPPSSSSSRPFSSAASSGGNAKGSQKKRPSGNVNRERNAFLFGEVTSEGSDDGAVSTDEIFGLEPIHRKEAGQHRSNSLPRVVEDVAGG